MEAADAGSARGVVLVAIAVALGIGLGKLVGGRFRELEDVRLKAEAWLLGLLAASMLLPRIAESSVPSAASAPVRMVWAVIILAVAFLAVVNRRTPGMGLMALGLLGNAVVILANSGMPVSSGAVAAAGSSWAGRAPTPFHVIAGQKTRLLLLGDVLPLPVPGSSGYVASVGDLLLLVGVVVFVAHGTIGQRAR